MRILLVGEGSGVDSLRCAYEAMGAEVKVCSLPDGVIGRGASAIIVDELFDEVERVILDGESVDNAPAGLLALIPSVEQEWRPPRPPQFHGNPRPYLKRKKGRP